MTLNKHRSKSEIGVVVLRVVDFQPVMTCLTKTCQKDFKEFLVADYHKQGIFLISEAKIV